MGDLSNEELTSILTSPVGSIEEDAKIADSRQFDWQAALDAAKRIVKLCDDSAFVAPEDLQRHGRLIDQVAEKLNEVAEALWIRLRRTRVTTDLMGRICAELQRRRAEQAAGREHIYRVVKEEIAISYYNVARRVADRLSVLVPSAEESSLRSVTDALVSARRVHNEENAKVEAWMKQEAREGSLVCNDEAPTWPGYLDALARWNAALAALDHLIAGAGS